MTKDQDLRATYKFAHGVHIVIIQQYDPKVPEWKTRTNIMVADEFRGRQLSDAINVMYIPT